jgi:hypothetical protein
MNYRVKAPILTADEQPQVPKGINRRERDMAVVGGLLIFVGMSGMVVAIWALVKGGLGWAGIASRKVASGVLAGSLAVFIAGGGISPKDDKADRVAIQARDTGSTPTTSPTPTSLSTEATTRTTIAPTTTSAPTTTTTQVPTTPTANVVGLALDKAHQKLEGLGFKKFDDRDYFENRSSWVESNWVVMEQRPTPEQHGDTGSKIVLMIGKIDENRTIDLLPEDSPVKQAALKKRANKAAVEAAKSKAAAEKRAKARVAYINRVDPALGLAQNTLLEIGKLGGEVRSGKVKGGAINDNVMGATTALDLLKSSLELLPPTDDTGLSQAHRDLLGGIDKYHQAASTLLSAEGASRVGALERFDTVITEAHKAWNDALAATYADTNIKPPLVP